MKFNYEDSDVHADNSLNRSAVLSEREKYSNEKTAYQIGFY